MEERRRQSRFIGSFAGRGTEEGERERDMFEQRVRKEKMVKQSVNKINKRQREEARASYREQVFLILSCTKENTCPKEKHDTCFLSVSLSLSPNKDLFLANRWSLG